MAEVPAEVVAETVAAPPFSSVALAMVSLPTRPEVVMAVVPRAKEVP